MKIYSKKQLKKSWAIELCFIPHTNSTSLAAVDADSGEFIANLIIFDENGMVLLTTNVDKTLVKNGYNPNEHKNRFDSKGRMVISNYRELI